MDEFNITIEEYLDYLEKNKLPEEIRCYDIDNVFIPGFKREHLYKEELWVTAKHPEHDISSYEVSSFGNMRDKASGKLRRNTIGVDGYIRQEFRDDLLRGHRKKGSKRTILANGKRNRHRSYGKLLFRHVVVLNSFVRNPNKLPVVDHINKVRNDNRLCNLRFVTRSQNSCNQTESNRRPTIEQIDGLTMEVIQNWTNISSIEKDLKLSGSNITKACKEESHYGCYLWRYIERLEENEVVKTIVYRGENITISSGGKVLTKNGRVTTGYIRMDRYRCVTINDKHFMIHDLVCTAFHGIKPSTSHTADHINGKRGDNNSNNLRWALPKEQTANRKFNATDYATNSKCIRVTDRLTGEKNVYKSITAAEKQLNSKPGDIQKTLNGSKVDYFTGYIIEYIR